VTTRWWTAFTAGPAYPPEPADLRTVAVVGLHLPARATVAIAVVTVALLLDYSRTFLPADLLSLGRAPELMRAVAIERAVVFGLLPMLVVLFVFRDRPTRYGVILGEWSCGSRACPTCVPTTRPAPRRCPNCWLSTPWS
jgi:hypothetical protein